jgi:hypothetical protein
VRRTSGVVARSAAASAGPGIRRSGYRKADRVDFERARSLVSTNGPFSATCQSDEWLQQCIEYFEDRTGQFFDVHNAHIWTDIKMHSTAQQV